MTLALVSNDIGPGRQGFLFVGFLFLTFLPLVKNWAGGSHETKYVAEKMNNL